MENSTNNIFTFVEESLHKKNERDLFDTGYLKEDDFKEILDLPVKNAKVLVENRNSIIYLIIIKDGKKIVGKQSKSLSFEILNQEYNSILKMYELNNAVFCNPMGFGLNREHNIYFLKYINFSSVAELLKSTNGIHNLQNISGLIGQGLFKIHSKLNNNMQYVDDNHQLIKDVLKTPIKINRRKKNILTKAKQALEGISFPYGLVYRDFDPLNVYVSGNTLSLIDPPERFVKTYLFWDIATFSVGIKKELIRRKFVISKEVYDKVDCIIGAITNEYIQNIKSENKNKNSVKLIILILELQRLGELIGNQLKHKHKNKKFSKAYLYNWIAILVLKKEYYRNIKIIKRLLEKNS